MIERFSAGFAITLVVAVCGFIAFAFEYNAFAGFFFALYLVALTTFLNLLGNLLPLINYAFVHGTNPRQASWQHSTEKARLYLQVELRLLNA